MLVRDRSGVINSSVYGVCWRHHSRMSLLSVRPNRRNLRDMMSSVNISGERHLGALSAVAVYIVHVYRYTLKSALIHRARYKIDSGDGVRARALRVFYSRGRLYIESRSNEEAEDRGESKPSITQIASLSSVAL